MGYALSEWSDDLNLLPLADSTWMQERSVPSRSVACRLDMNEHDFETHILHITLRDIEGFPRSGNAKVDPGRYDISKPNQYIHKCGRGAAAHGIADSTLLANTHCILQSRILLRDALARISEQTHSHLKVAFRDHYTAYHHFAAHRSCAIPQRWGRW
jgi:hypothetical protein